MKELNDIKTGFNHGYDLKRFAPELAQELYDGFKVLKEKNDYQNAFLKGCDQADKEPSKRREKTRIFSLGKFEQSLGKEHSKPKDRDDRDV